MGIKKKKFTKDNLIYSLKVSAPLYVMLGLMVFIRMWFTRMNTDALYYASLSQKMKGGISFDAPMHYQIVSMYSLAAIVNKPIDFYTIVSDILVLTIISILIYKIMLDIRSGFDTIFWVFLIALSIIVALSLPYVTSSLNWVSTSMVALSILAFRKNVIMMILAPLALTSFSFSATLFLPVALIVAFLNKRFTLRELIKIGVLGMVSFIIFASVAFELNMKFFILITLLSIAMLPIDFIPDKEFKNPIYKINIGAKYSIDKKFKVVSLIIIILLLILLQISLCLTIWRSGSWTLIFRYRMWLIPLFGLVILECLWKKRVTFWLSFFISFFIVASIYLVAIKILPDRIPSFSFDRLMEPLITITLVFFLLFLYEKNMQKYISLNYLFISIAFVLVSINNYYLAKPSYFYSNPSTNVARNYKWITNNEWKIISSRYKNTSKKIYSDLPLFVMDESINSLMNAEEHRILFHGDLFITMNGRKEFVNNNIDSIKNEKSGDKAYKMTIEYAQNTGDWSEIDKAGIFIFRHKVYAEKIVAHYSQFTHKSIEEVNGLFIVK